MGARWGSWTCRTGRTSPGARSVPARVAQTGRHPWPASCPTRTNAAVSTRPCARTLPRKRPESHQTRPENRSTTSGPTGPGSEPTGTRCRASWTCGQTTRGAGRRCHGTRRTCRRHTTETAACGRARNGRRKRPRRSAGSGRPSRDFSADAQAIEQENKDTHSGWLEGFEHRLKGEDRLLEKVAEGLTTTSPDATPKQVLRLIPDAIRFTYCFQAESYTRGSTPGTLGVSVFLGCSAFRVLYVFLSLFSWWCRRRAGTGGTRVSRRVRRAVPRSAAPGRGGPPS